MPNRDPNLSNYVSASPFQQRFEKKPRGFRHDDEFGGPTSHLSLVLTGPGESIPEVV